MTSAAATATAIAGLVAALLGVLRYFNYKTKKDRLAAVGDAFAEIVKGLSSTDEVQRVSNAILLRRFFDPHSEFAVRYFFRGWRVPYAVDAVNVIAAVLRTEPTGTVQKVLSDGLAYAPTLSYADLQRTNLCDAYLGAKEAHRPPEMRRTDFWRADLTLASFKEAHLPTAVFYEATLVKTIFNGAHLAEANLCKADLTLASFKEARLPAAAFSEATLVRTNLSGAHLEGADFSHADLAGANLSGAHLGGASFEGAKNLPPGLEEHLDAERRYVGDAPFVPSDEYGHDVAERVVFVSAPSVVDAPARAVHSIVVDALRAEGLAIKHVKPTEYGPGSPLRLVKAAMNGCSGVAVIGVGQLRAKSAQLRAGTSSSRTLNDVILPTPWNQIEAGMAAALGLPLLVVWNCSSGGVFGLDDQGDEFRAVKLDDDWDVGDVQRAVRDWARTLRPSRR